MKEASVKPAIIDDDGWNLEAAIKKQKKKK